MLLMSVCLDATQLIKDSNESLWKLIVNLSLTLYTNWQTLERPRNLTWHVNILVFHTFTLFWRKVGEDKLASA